MNTAEGSLNEWALKLLPALVAISIFMQMLDVTILNTALPAIANDLNESPLQMQSVIISYSLILAIFSPLSGVIADKLGSKPIFIMAIVIFSLGSLYCALSQSLMHLVIGRVIQAIGSSFLAPIARLAIMKSYPKSQLLKIMNYALMPALLGPLMGPVLGGYFVDYLSWHWIFLINIPVGMICLIMAFFLMPNFKNKETHLDIIGFLIFSFSIFLVTLGMELISKIANHIIPLFALILGALLFTLYWIYAFQSSFPLFSPQLFKIRTYRISIYGNLIARLGIATMPFVLPLLLQVGMGYSAAEAGWMVAPLAIGSLLAKPVVTYIIHQFGYRKTLMTNTVIIGLIIITIGFIAPNAFWLVLLVLLFFLGFCNSIQFSAMNTIAIADLADDQISSGNSLLNVNQQIAITFSVSIAAIFLNFFQANPLGTFDQNVQAFQNTLITMGMMTIFASFIFQRLSHSDGDNLANRE